MKVVNNRNNDLFLKVNIGDVFAPYEDGNIIPYMKIQEVYNGIITVNAVHLQSGELFYFDASDSIVRMPDAEVHLN